MASSHSQFAVLLLCTVASAFAKPNTLGFECTEQGRFANPNDCTQFFTCVKDQDGEFVSSKGSCKGYAFDDERKICVSPEKVPGCSLRDSRQIISDSRYDDLCTTDAFICVDCKTVINCVDGRAFIDSSCDTGFTCQTPVPFQGEATCYNTNTEDNKCKCYDPDTFKSDPWNVNGFFFCPPVDSDPMVHHCPGEMTFDETQLDCANADGIPACSKSGVFANPSNCTQYYTCIQTSDGWVQKSFACNEDLMYNENTKNCSDPCAWPKLTFDCSEEGRFADPADCGNFFVCISDLENDGHFIQTHRKCPLDYIWDPLAAEGSGHCESPNDPATTKCSPVKENTCDIPDTCEAPAMSEGGRNRLAFRRQTPDSDVFGEDPIKNVIQILQNAKA